MILFNKYKTIADDDNIVLKNANYVYNYIESNQIYDDGTYIHANIFPSPGIPYPGVFVKSHNELQKTDPKYINILINISEYIKEQKINTGHFIVVQHYDRLFYILKNNIINNIFDKIYMVTYYITFIRNYARVNSHRILSIKKNEPYIKCGISKNKDLYKKYIFEKIMDNNIDHRYPYKNNNNFINFLMNYTESIKDNIFRIPILKNHIIQSYKLIGYENVINIFLKKIIGNEMESKYDSIDRRYIITMSINNITNITKICNIVICCFIEYIIINNPIKFMKNIIFDKFIKYSHSYNYDRYYQKYKLLIKNEYYNIYDEIFGSKILLLLYPDMKKIIYRYINNKIDENQKKINIYLEKIYKYNHSEHLPKVIDEHIRGLNKTYIGGFSTLCMDVEYKEYFKKIQRLINESRYYRINFDLM